MTITYGRKVRAAARNYVRKVWKEKEPQKLSIWWLRIKKHVAKTYRVGNVERVVVGVRPAHALNSEGERSVGLAVVTEADLGTVKLAGRHEGGFVHGGQATKSGLRGVYEGVVVDAYFEKLESRVTSDRRSTAGLMMAIVMGMYGRSAQERTTSTDEDHARRGVERLHVFNKVVPGDGA